MPDQTLKLHFDSYAQATKIEHHFEIVGVFPNGLQPISEGTKIVTAKSVSTQKTRANARAKLKNQAALACRTMHMDFRNWLSDPSLEHEQILCNKIVTRIRQGRNNHTSSMFHVISRRDWARMKQAVPERR